MRVALDATPLVEPTGGLARYTAELSRALAENFREDEYTLFSDQLFAMPEPRLANLRRGDGPRNAIERRWWLWGLARQMIRHGCELFHGTDFAVPYVPLRPSVMTVHDLSPWMNPSWHHDADRVRRRTPPLVGLGIATMLVTPTEAVRRQVVERFRVPPACVVAVPHGASNAFRPVPAPRSAPYFLYAGTLEPRKNLHELIGAWRSVRSRHPVDLVLAGRRRVDFAEISAEPGLRVLGEVTDEDLARLCSGALAFVYPSHYEGFGLPVLEAMQCGACVFVARDAAVCEVAGDAGLSLDGANAWKDAMSKAASDAEWVARRRKMSLERSREFSWARTAQLTREVYREAERRFRG